MKTEDVAAYLRDHPEFFADHGELLASLTLPHPHAGRAISLTERQMMTLRDKNKALELKIAQLIRFGQENDAIAEKIRRWTRTLLIQRNSRMLPDGLLASLAEIFSISQAALRVWEVQDELADLACAAPVPVDLISYANRMGRPYVGVPVEDNAMAVALLEPHVTQSVAIVPLRRGATPESFGLLVLGSADARRFHADLGTDFLENIGEIASAALSRLLA